MRKAARRPVPVVRLDSNIPLIALENYEVVRREMFSRPQTAFLLRKAETGKDEHNKE